MEVKVQKKRSNPERFSDSLMDLRLYRVYHYENTYIWLKFFDFQAGLVWLRKLMLKGLYKKFFKQKRVGIHKTHFFIYKFRSMRVDTPKDVPTHELEAPQKWITRVGGFLRMTSLDEIPQLFNILGGSMSFIGPRPALWNQYDLIAERDKYGANDVPVGLTGWAQINGRDELEIPVKAALDGEYAKRQSFAFDCKCVWGTFFSVLNCDGVFDGRSGELHKHKRDAYQ